MLTCAKINPPKMLTKLMTKLMTKLITKLIPEPLLESKKTAVVQSSPLQCLINDNNTAEKSKIISDEQVNHLNLVIQDQGGHDPVNHVVVVVPNDVVNVVVVVPSNEAVKTVEESSSPQ